MAEMNGSPDRVTNKQLYDALKQMQQETLDRIDRIVAEADEKYVLRAACRERHRYLDPRQVWTSVGILSLVLPILTALGVYYLTH